MTIDYIRAAMILIMLGFLAISFLVEGLSHGICIAVVLLSGIVGAITFFTDTRADKNSRQ